MFEFNYYNPVRTVFGIGKVNVAGEKAAELGKKALLVNYKEPGVLLPLLNRIKGMLDKAGVLAIEFYAFEENPAIETVAEGVALAKQSGCDLVIAVGGGSVMDGAKAIAAGVYYDGDLWNMVYHRHDGSNAQIRPPAKALPILAIPTLPATGSEMNMCAVVTNRRLKEKSYIWAECIFPKVAILDPELTVSLPHAQSASAAADTISHVLEIYINSREDTPLQHYWQEGCMRTAMENITKALDRPDDLEARGNLMWSATCAINGWAWPGDGWTPMHQIGHVLTTRHRVNHGNSLSVLMPHWMRYNAPRRPKVYTRFAVRVMDVDPKGKNSDAVIREGIDRFHAFLKKIGVPTSLGEVGIKEQDLAPILKDAVKVSFGTDGNLACNPVMTQADVMNVLKLAL